MDQQLKSDQLPASIAGDFVEIFIDGPMSVTNVNTIAVITFTRIRPKVEDALQGKSNFEVEAACRISMPIDVLKQMANMLAQHQFAITPPAGSA
jgi:hypothetical protein